MQHRQVTEPPSPPILTSERLPTDGGFPPLEEPGPSLQPSAPGLFVPWERPFLPGMAPRPAPRLSRGEIGIQSATTVITVVETYDHVWGYHANADDTLLLRLYDGATLKGFGVARTDGMGYFYGEFFDQGSQVEIAPGDTVKVGTGSLTETIQVVQITGTADPLNDQVTGVITGTGLSLPVSVTVGLWFGTVDQTVSTDGMGNFTVDFSAACDMDATDNPRVGYEDSGGNWVETALSPVGFFAVFQTFDEVDGYAAPGATVTITRTPQMGPQESDTTTASTNDGSYWVGFAAIEPNDVIEVDNGSSLISTTVVSLTATATPWVNDIITGTAPADSEVGVAVWQISPVGRWLWHKKTVTSGGSGDYSADFSGILNLDRMSGVWVIFPDISGNETIILYRPPLAAVNETYNNVWGNATPGALVTATLKDSGGGTKETESTTSHSAAGYYEIGFDADVQTGDSVEVTGGGMSATVAVTTLTALADTDADTISGLSPASSDLIVRGWRWDYIAGPSFDEFVTSTGGGGYTDNLSGRYDLYNGYQGHVHYSQPDEHKVFVHYHAPGIHVNQTHDGALGYVDTANIPVTFTLRTAGDVQKDQTVITSEQTDGYIQAWFDGSVDIVPGDKVEVETASWTNLVTVTALSLDVDVDTDIVSGTGPPNTIVKVTALDRNWEFLGEMLVPTDDSGNFTADLSDQMDIKGGMWIRLGAENEGHNENYIGGILPYLRVNQTHDWIQGVGTPNAAVNITVTRGTTSFTGSTTADGSGWYHVGRWDFGAQPLDIQVDDSVEMTSDGVSRSLTVMAMSGNPDVDADTISGNIAGAGDSDPVLIDIWEKGGGGAETTTDASGNYSTNLGGPDLKAGHELAVWYVTEEGDECGIVVRYLQIRANITSDWIDGDTKPNTTVSITLTGSGIKGTGDPTSDKDGRYATDVYTDGTRADIAIGDTISATADGREASLFIGGPLTAQANETTDEITGEAPPNTDLFVDIWDYGWFDVQSDEFGDYNFDAGAEGIDLQAGMGGMVGYRTEEGHQIGVDFWLPFVRVNQTHDWMEGIATANATVNLTVTRGVSTFLGSTTADGGGWFHIEGRDFSPEVDIQVDDLVEMSSDGISRSLDVVAMTGNPDVDADTISGNVAGAHDGEPVRIEIWEEGGGDLDVTTDGDGNYFADLSPWDLTSGDTVAVWYITPEGDELGAVFEVPFARVNYTWDGVDGRVAPSATVYVTVTDISGVKGTNSDTANPDGWFGLWAGANVVPGDTVYATSPAGLDATMEVITITGDVDVDTDIVSGTMYGGDFPATGEVEVGQPPDWEPNDWMPIDIDVLGDYEADFSGQFDIQLGYNANVWYHQPDGHQIGVGLYTVPLEKLEVHQTHDWVQVQGQPGNTVYFTVTNGPVKGTASAVIQENGWVWTRIYSGTERVDIEVGDIVEASSEGYLRSAQVITITALVDPDANTVQGQIVGAAEYPADLHVDVWVPGTNIGKDAQTDGSGNYFVDLDQDYNIQMGDELTVWYHEPDGDAVGGVFSALLLRVSSSNDDFWGQTGPPDIPITLTLKDSGGSTKGQAFRSADKDGTFAGIFWDGFDRIDIEAGDTVEAETSIVADSVYILPLPAWVEVANDVINGTCVPNAYMSIWISRGEDQAEISELPTDGSGDFTADFGAIGWNILAGDYVDIDCRIPQGHAVHRGFEVHAVYVPLVMKKSVGFGVAGEAEAPMGSPSPTSTPVLSPTATLVPTPTSTPTAVPPATPTGTAVPTSTPVATPTPTLTPTPADTATAVPTATPTATTGATSTPVATPTPTSTTTPTGTPTEVLPPVPEACPTPEES